MWDVPGFCSDAWSNIDIELCTLIQGFLSKFPTRMSVNMPTLVRARSSVVKLLVLIHYSTNGVALDSRQKVEITKC